MTLKITAVLSALLVCVLLLWKVDHVTTQRDIALDAAASVREALSASQAELVQARDDSRKAQALLDSLAQIQTGIDTLSTTVRRNQSIQQKALQELIENDQVLRSYMDTSVPADLGLLYQRPETTDPAAYTSSGSMPADPVRTPGPSTGPK